MTTRSSGSAVKSPVIEGTEFQLHKSQQSIFNGIQDAVIDFTEHRLLRYSTSLSDPQQKKTLLDLVEQYRKGAVAVSWRSGRPAWLRVIKDA